MHACRSTLEDPTPARLVTGGFDNNAELIGVDDATVAAYQEAAERLGQYATSSAARLAAIGFSCPAGATRASCLEPFIARFGRLAFRRPLGADERSGLLTLAQAAGPTDHADVRAVLEALFQAPSFLDRVEKGAPVAGEAEKRSLLPWELATRVSFLLLGKGPDAALLDAADQGELDTPAGLSATVAALLTRAESLGTFQRFSHQWLGLTRIEAIQRPPAQYPLWTPATRSAAREEGERLVDEYLSASRPFLGVLTADHSDINADLARLYGLPTPPAGWSRRTWLPADPRGGFLTLASTLASSAHLEATAPITRGLFVRLYLMCEPFAPPANIPALPAATSPTTTARERLAAHRANPACSNCHSKLEPVGFAFSRYDIIGAYREKDALGRTIDDSGSLTGWDQVEFQGPKELGAKLEQSRQVKECMVRYWLRYSLGRIDRSGDTALVRTLTDSFVGGDGRLQSLLVDFVQSPAFRFRRDPRTQE